MLFQHIKQGRRHFTFFSWDSVFILWHVFYTSSTSRLRGAPSRAPCCRLRGAGVSRAMLLRSPAIYPRAAPGALQGPGLRMGNQRRLTRAPCWSCAGLKRSRKSPAESPAAWAAAPGRGLLLCFPDATPLNVRSQVAGPGLPPGPRLPCQSPPP